MASSCLRVPITLSISTTSSPKNTLRKTNLNTKRCVTKTRCSSSARIPTPPLNPNDPFLAKLASAAAACPDKVLDSLHSKTGDSPPYMDLFESPQLMAAPAQVERSASYNEHRSRRPPPDLPSLLLHGRIVYIGMPLVAAVTELVVAQLMYLQWMDPKEPIYLYINSTGTSNDDGETVALETEGFAIYDALMQLKNEIRTLCVGAATGQACLLLAAGTKGKRYMLPHSLAMIQQPRVPSAGLMPAADVLIRAKEAITNRDTLVELLAKHTENSVETVAKVMRRPFYMDAAKAQAFGVIDKILWRGQEQIMADVVSPEEWDKIAGIGAADGI